MGCYALDSAFCLISVICGYCCGGGQSGEPFEAKADVGGFRCYRPCRECHVWAEAPSAVGERAETVGKVVARCFGLACELVSKLGEDVAWAGGELRYCGGVSGREPCGDDRGPPFGFHFVVLSLLLMGSAGG